MHVQKEYTKKRLFRIKTSDNEFKTKKVSFLLRKFRDAVAQQLRFGHSSTKFAKATAFAH